MKKMLIIFVAMLCILSVAAIAGAAVKDIEGTGYVGATGSTLSISTSSNVRISYVATDQAYGAKGQHKAGSRVYATGSATPGIWYRDKIAGTFDTTDVTETFVGTDWTAQ
jgi:uncharacterized protein YxeA